MTRIIAGSFTVIQVELKQYKNLRKIKTFLYKIGRLFPVYTEVHCLSLMLATKTLKADSSGCVGKIQYRTLAAKTLLSFMLHYVQCHFSAA